MGFKVEGLGFRVGVLGFWVKVLGFRGDRRDDVPKLRGEPVHYFRPCLLEFGVWVLGLGCGLWVWALGFGGLGFWARDPRTISDPT